MITQNISTSAGIVNGTTGLIKGFLYTCKEDVLASKIPLGVFVQMDDIKDKAILITPCAGFLPMMVNRRDPRLDSII